MSQLSQTPTRSQQHGEDGVTPLEDLNAELERALIMDYLRPHLPGWSTLSIEEQRRLRCAASTWASCKLAAAHSCCGLLVGFIALLHAANGGLH